VQLLGSEFVGQPFPGSNNSWTAYEVTTPSCTKCRSDKFLKPQRANQSYRVCAACGHRFNIDKARAALRDITLKPLKEAEDKFRRAFRK
jgi:hypothetical protein